MNTFETAQRAESGSVYFYAIMWLFLIQLLTDFVEAIYAFGLLGTGIPVEILFVLLFFSPALLLLSKKGPSRGTLIILGEAALACRLIEPLLDTRGRMIVSGVGVACLLIFYPCLLRLLGRKKGHVLRLASGLTLGTAALATLRALDAGMDLSTYGWTQGIAWLLAIPTGIEMLRVVPRPSSHATEGYAKIGFGRLLLLALGWTAGLFLIYSAFSAPNVISRWSGESFLGIVIALMVSLAVFESILYAGPALDFIRIFRKSQEPDWVSGANREILLAGNILFVAAMSLGILAHQIRFPANAEAYPIYAPDPPGWARIPLYAMLILFPVVILDLTLIAEGLAGEATGASQRTGDRAGLALGGAFSLASLFLVLMIFAHVFTTVYDYIPVIGPYFRDQFWLVYLGAGSVLAATSIATYSRVRASPSQKGHLTAPIGMGAMAVLAIASVLVNTPRPLPVDPSKSSLKILTYNIQQGYSAAGLKNFSGQLELIRSVDADVIGLQESDTNRISGGNSDIVGYFASRLNLYSYYGPKTVMGTFGIALLSKYPLEEARTFYMYSAAEQTASISVRIRVGERTVNLFVTHLGNGGPIIQQEQLLQEVDGKQPAVVMGDFNFTPDSEPYRLTTRLLQDAWLLKWPSGIDDQGVNPVERIDHVFLSPGIRVIEARYLLNPQSDHPALSVEIGW